MRRMFALTEEDETFLNAKGYEWEAIVENGAQWVIIKNHPAPDGYNVKNIEVAILLVAGYPMTPLDMVYCYPHLILQNGKTINALSSHMLDGRDWQRWSRHRTAVNPWRPGVDDISTHLAIAEEWFKREVTK